MLKLLTPKTKEMKHLKEIDLLKEKVSEILGIDISTNLKSRSGNYPLGRQFIMYYATQVLKMRQEDACLIFEKDRTTVPHSVNAISNMIDTNYFKIRPLLPLLNLVTIEPLSDGITRERVICPYCNATTSNIMTCSFCKGLGIMEKVSTFEAVE